MGLTDILPRAASGTGSHRGGGSNSLSGLFSTMIPVLLVAIIVVAIFLVFRPKVDRVYQPRGLNTFITQHDRTPLSKKGMFAWVSNYRSLPDEFILRHNSLDNYLYLRFFKLMVVICVVGCCITWPILFPVNATGGGGQSQLDKLSFSNVNPSYRYFAHAIVAWLFMGFIMFAVTRERMFYIGLRQAYFLSSFHAQRLSSRTVMFLCLPKQNVGEAQLRTIFGPAIRRIWMVQNCEDLEEKVEKRNKEYTKLENGQVKFITNTIKQHKNGKLDEKTVNSQEGPSRFLTKKSRPTHKLKPIVGKKVDTLDHCRTEGPKLANEIERSQRSFLDGEGENASACFIEFTTQETAQRAYQLMAKEKKTEFHPRFIGVRPSEIVWKKLHMGLAARKSKNMIATIFISLLILFWSIPVAVVGAISNINYLTTEVPFLSFINSIPKVILGVVTGLLPVVLLAVLMALVPIICRLLAKWAGEPTLSRIELKTQAWYFAFQLIQVFLVTTFASGASTVAAQIVQNPTSAVSLLAKNLPKASNFYIDYFLLFGLSSSAMLLLNAVPFVMIVVLGKYMDKTPRKQFKRWINLQGLGWGSLYPKFTNLGVIAISYSCIAPLILGFASVGLSLLYLAFRYNMLFTLGNKVDTKGECYARALQQLLSGVYLSCICLIGLFAIGTASSKGAIGPLVLMIILLVVVVVFQIMVDKAFAPLEQNLPLELLHENEKSMTLYTAAEEGRMDGKGRPLDDEARHMGDQNRYTDGETRHMDGQNRHMHDEARHMDGQGQHLDGDSSHVRNTSEKFDNTGELHNSNTRADDDNSRNNGAVPQRNAPTSAEDQEQKKPNFLTRWAKPFVYKSYRKNKTLLSSSEAEDTMPEYEIKDERDAYQNPAITSPRPLIWLARDELGISKMFADENQKAGIKTSDEGAWYDEKGKVTWDHENMEKMPIWDGRTTF